MERKIVFFINPVSGGKSKDVLIDKIKTACRKENLPFEILYTNAEGDYRFLPEKIIKEKITDVAICGGDGSLAPVISFLLSTDVNVGIIPLGSGNGLARTAGIPNNTNKALKVIFSGKPVLVDAFRVNNRFGCQITGFGFDALVAAEFAKERKRGLSAYTRLAVKNFFSARSYRFSLSFNGKLLDTEAFILCVANANQFGNNMKIAPGASLHDGLLDLVILQKTTKLNILISFISHLLFTKKSGTVSAKDDRNIFYANCKELTIKNPDNAPIHIDGDPFESSAESFNIEILPAAYKLIIPS